MQKKWENIEELEPLIAKYFDDCDSEKRPYTVSGLACALETTRKTLMEYQVKDEFSKLLISAKAKCENYAEEKLYTGGNVAGVIFSMKNNYGWKDKLDLGHGSEEDEEGTPKKWKIEVTHVTKEKS